MKEIESSLIDLREISGHISVKIEHDVPRREYIYPTQKKKLKSHHEERGRKNARSETFTERAGKKCRFEVGNCGVTLVFNYSSRLRLRLGNTVT